MECDRTKVNLPTGEEDRTPLRWEASVAMEEARLLTDLLIAFDPGQADLVDNNIIMSTAITIGLKLAIVQAYLEAQRVVEVAQEKEAAFQASPAGKFLAHGKAFMPQEQKKKPLRVASAKA